MGVFHCTFINIGDKDTTWTDRREYGLFNYPLKDGGGIIYACRPYSPTTIANLDPGEMSARVFGALGYILHVTTLLLVLITEMCLRTSSHLAVERIWLTSRIILIWSFVCSILIFRVYAKEECTNKEQYPETICSPGPAGIMALFNIVILIPTIVLSWLTGSPTHPCLYVRWWQDGDGNIVEGSTNINTGDDNNKPPPSLAFPSTSDPEQQPNNDNSNNNNNNNLPVIDTTLEMEA